MYITGFHSIEEKLKSDISNIECLYVSKIVNSRVSKVLELAKKLNIKIIKNADISHVEDAKFLALKISSRVVNSFFSYKDIKDFQTKFTKQQSLVLILDGITDPHNYGAILRSSDIFGVDLVILPNRRSASDSDTVSSVSSGAVNYVPHIFVPNLVSVIDVLKEMDYWVYSADLDGKTLWTQKFEGRVAIVMGSEGKGVSRLISENCDEVITIPNYGHIDSLNVSVAAGIISYEVIRQFNLK